MICHRCGADAGDWNEPRAWITGSMIQRLRVAWRRLVRWALPRCDECRKSLVFRRGVGKYGDRFCSEKCMKDSLPF